MRINDSVSSRTRAKVRGLFAAAAIGLLASAGAANAVTVTGSYTVTYTPSVQSGHTQTGAPTFSNPASNALDNQSGTTTGASYHGYFSYALGTSGPSSTITKNLVEIDPSYSCGSWCVGGNTQTGTVTVTFSFSAPSGGTSTDLTETGVYQARYNGPTLSCAIGDGKSPQTGSHNDTDCINWNNDPDPLAISFPGGYSLSVSLLDDTDWSITPQVVLTLSQTQGAPGDTPLPGALPLFVSGSGLLGLISWRRKRRMAKKAASA